MTPYQPAQSIDDLRLFSREDLTDAPEVTPAQAELNRIMRKGPRRPRPARKGLLGVSEATLDRMVVNGLFPRPVKLGPRMVRWPAHAVRDWLKRQHLAA